ncbi:hypothetical protein [uncultured Alsobacter sp.]|uniref:hypothetical protein n=1 Tax=uncultured Alsobacter sp. TaxID=1748258 RepID=UPI0025D4BBEA|nr:hypothetical protein [uncultured Alsobacter sp.]
MKLDKAVAALEVAGARKRVRAAEAEARATKLSARLRLSRQREAPRRRYLAPDVIRAAMLAGEGRSAAEIATELGGTTARRVAALCHKHGIRLVPKRNSEACVRVVIPRSSLDALARISVDRDETPEIVMASALAALAAEPTVLANLLDDDA